MRLQSIVWGTLFKRIIYAPAQKAVSSRPQFDVFLLFVEVLSFMEKQTLKVTQRQDFLN